MSGIVTDCCTQAIDFKKKLETAQDSILKLTLIEAKKDTIILRFSQIEQETTGLLEDAGKALQSEVDRANSAEDRLRDESEAHKKTQKELSETNVKLLKAQGKTWFGRQFRKIDKAMSKLGYLVTAGGVAFIIFQTVK